MDNKIVVTGGSGMVGQGLQKIYPHAIYLNSSTYDLTDQNDVRNMIRYHKPDVIIHLAARVGGIMANINQPSDYYDDNVLMNTMLIHEARKAKIDKLIAVLSTCIYPDVLPDELYPMKEEVLHMGAPTPTNFSYGYAKRSMAVQIDACNQQYGTKYQYLTPCNLYGVGDKSGKNSHFIGALIEKIHTAKTNNDDHIVLFGSGTPLRQFLLTDDFCKVISMCIEEGVYENMNVAIGENLSIKDMAKIALKALDAEHLDIRFDSTKPDGQFRKDVSIEKLKSVFPDWEATSLEKGIKQTYESKYISST
jgi:GDP-L-fucose synthase|tara:strand:+ start:35380 stop:36297 length:918 start_codon:yes stop_codon:yes gene_type:complete